MCLIIPELNRKVADKDIVCYKILHKPKGYKTLHAIFQGTMFNIGKRYKTPDDGYPVYETGCCAFKYGNKFYIEKGCFHSFKTIQGARGYLKKADFYKPEYPIVKCLIPTGSEYFCGKFDDYYQSYASREIELVEVVK